MALPPTFSLAALMDEPVPGDLTLGEVRAFMVTTDTLKAVAQMMPRKQVFIHFRHRPGDEEFEDTELMERFRALVKLGRAAIVIDDCSGGVRVPEKV